MSQKHVTRSKRSRGKARQARREAREVREMLKMPVESRRANHRRAKESRRRLLHFIYGLLGFAAVAASGWFLFQKAFYDNPEFMLKHVEVLNDGMLTKKEILKAAQVPATINLLEIDLRAIDTRLRERSQIKDVRVQRKVPDTLEIMVWERTPVAWLGYQGGELDKRHNGVLLDASATAICCHTLYKELYDFPVVLIPRDVMEGAVKFGEKVELAGVQSALELIQLWPISPPHPSLHIAQVDASRHFRLEVDCQPEMRLIFQPKKLSGQLLKLTDVLEHGGQQNRYFAQVDLTVADNVPVIYHEESFTPDLSAPALPNHMDAPHWQPRSGANHNLSEQELRAILSVDS